MTALLDAPDLARTARELEAIGGEPVAAFIDAMEPGAPFPDFDLPPIPAPSPRDELGQLRELFRIHGADLDDHAVARAVQRLAERGHMPIAGGATGQQATAYMSNLPAEGSFVMNPDAFATETERNDMPLEQKAIGALGGAPIDLRIPNIGVLTHVRLIVKGTLVVAGGGSVTSRYTWPWNLFSRVTLNLQGQTSLFSVEGGDLRQRRQRVYRRPTEDVSTAPAMNAPTGSGDPNPGVIANGSYAVVLVYDVPIVHDPYTLTGAVYAQSDSVYLNWRIQLAQTAELFTLAGGSTAVLTGTIDTTITFYDIPFQDTQNGRTVLLPDMRWLHSMISADKPVVAVGNNDTELIRTAGQLLSIAAYVDNGGAALIDPSAWTQAEFRYGGNRQPRVFAPIEMLLEKNVQDYGGRIRPGWAILDFAVDNQTRELVYPKGVTELKVRIVIPAGTTTNAGAHTHVVSETLFVGS
jgi:hypothetical protein